MKRKIPAKSQSIVPVLQLFKTDLQKLYGDRFVKLILFGSYARGKQHSESDIDLLLILNDMESPYREVNFMNQLTSDFLFEYEMFFSVIATTSMKFETMSNPLYYNVKKEGVLV